MVPASVKKRCGRKPPPPPAKFNASKSIAAAKELLGRWQLRDCIAELDALLAIEPENQGALQVKVMVQSYLSDFDGARATVTKLHQLFPTDTIAIRHMAALGLPVPPATKDSALAEVWARGGSANAFRNGAIYLHEAGMFEDAIDLCTIGIAAAGQTNDQKMAGQLRLRMGLSLEGLERFSEAIDLYLDLASDPLHYRHASTSIARCWLELGKAADAELMLKAVLPRTGGDGAMAFSPLTLDVLQARGKLRESYQLYRRRNVSAALATLFGGPPLTELDLSSQHFDSALMIAEGGPGDELRLSSLYEDVHRRVTDLTITSDPRLTPIMQRSFPDITFLPIERHRREIAKPMTDRTLINDACLFLAVGDRAVEVGRTKQRVFSVLDTLADLRPDIDAYVKASPRSLKPLPALVDHWQTAVAAPGKLKVGIAWRSMLLSVARNRHYLTVDELAPLGLLRDAKFWLLQPTATDDEVNMLRSMVDLSIPEGLDLVADIEGQLALCSCLDVVVGPFTTSSELAAASGTPTALLSLTRSTMWRRTERGADIFRPNAHIFSLAADRQDGMRAVADFLDAQRR